MWKASACARTRVRCGIFAIAREIEQVHVAEIRQLLLEVSGADHVSVTGAGVLRFGERSRESGAHNNSRPARFVHVDVSDVAAASFYARSRPDNGRAVRRAAQYNVWRVLTAPPQDVPLAVCDARSVAPGDFIAADAMFDKDGAIAFSFEALAAPAQSRTSAGRITRTCMPRRR